MIVKLTSIETAQNVWYTVKPNQLTHQRILRHVSVHTPILLYDPSIFFVHFSIWSPKDTYGIQTRTLGQCLEVAIFENSKMFYTSFF